MTPFVGFVPVVAHASHWLTSVIYFVPVLVVVGALAWQTIKDRRAGNDRDGSAP